MRSVASRCGRVSFVDDLEREGATAGGAATTGAFGVATTGAFGVAAAGGGAIGAAAGASTAVITLTGEVAGDGATAAGKGLATGAGVLAEEAEEALPVGAGADALARKREAAPSGWFRAVMG